MPPDIQSPQILIPLIIAAILAIRHRIGIIYCSRSMSQEWGNEGTARSIGGWLEDVDFGVGAGYFDLMEDVGEHAAVIGDVRDVYFGGYGGLRWRGGETYPMSQVKGVAKWTQCQKAGSCEYGCRTPQNRATKMKIMGMKRRAVCSDGAIAARTWPNVETHVSNMS